MILKAGTYRFNDVISRYTTSYNVSANFTCNGIAYNLFVFDGGNDNMWGLMYVNTDSENTTICYAIGIEGFTEGWQGDYQEHTIDEQEVDDTFGTWYIASTNYNEVNAKPIAEITYNGETIAQLNAGETCTLKCTGLPMETDIIIKINEVN